MCGPGLRWRVGEEGAQGTWKHKRGCFPLASPSLFKQSKMSPVPIFVLLSFYTLLWINPRMPPVAGSTWLQGSCWLLKGFTLPLPPSLSSQYALYRKMIQAAILIQSKFRSYYEQKKFQQSRRAAVLIQQFYRSYRECGKRRQSRRTAALVQQKLR